MTARFDRSALALDVGQATGAYGEVIALMKKVGAYTSAMGELNLDAVPVHGTSIDPFYNLPGLRQALAAARAHTPEWGTLSQRLFMQLLEGAMNFTPSLTASAGEIRQILAAAETAGRMLTPAERASIVAKLQALEAQLQRDRDQIAGLRTATVDFCRLIAGDYATLTTGSQRIDEAIPAVDKATMDAALKYIGPGGEGIYRMVIELGAKIRAKLVSLTAAVHSLVDANDASQRALQSVLTAWATVDGKFKSVITTLGEGERASDAFLELPLLLEIAAESWQQLLTYFTGKLSSAVL